MFKTLSQRLPSMSKSTFADSVDQDQTAHNVQSDLYLLCLIIRVLCLEKKPFGFSTTGEGVSSKSFSGG